MRHNNSVNKLGRTSSHRKAMMSNMASSLILHKRIQTTVAKAKALRPYVEKLITKSREDNTHSRRIVFSHLQNKYSTKELFTVVADKIASRPGGYTRILKSGTRYGDNAEMCIMELVDFNEFYQKGDTVAKSKRSRRGSGTKTKKSDVENSATSSENTSPAQDLDAASDSTGSENNAE